MSAELHKTRIFEGRSADWTTVPQPLTSYLDIKIIRNIGFTFQKATQYIAVMVTKILTNLANLTNLIS